MGPEAKLRLAVIAGNFGPPASAWTSYGDRGMKGAMKGADRSGARLALVLGDRDLEAGEIGLKDLATGEQSSIPLSEATARVRATLSPVS